MVSLMKKDKKKIHEQSVLFLGDKKQQHTRI